jgi:hypothetical protein
VGKGGFLDISDKALEIGIEKALNPFGRGKEFVTTI